MKKDLVPIYQLEKENNKLKEQNKEMLEDMKNINDNLWYCVQCENIGLRKHEIEQLVGLSKRIAKKYSL